MRLYCFVVRGIVQGVGFRPYIYRKAVQLGLLGTVKNIGSGVEIVVNDKDFISKLTDLPPLAKIDSVKIEEVIPNGKFKSFSILKSETSDGETLVPPDIFLCDDCLRELRDPGNRRRGYYFMTCTNCGPRFTIIEDYPYDRPLTSMKDFPMCPSCKAEYSNPLDRRYHAQTVACTECGPRLRLIKKVDGEIGGMTIDMTELTDSETIRVTAKLLSDGQVVAIKGVGGFHLCSTVANVTKVRTLLRRPDKPFAFMVGDVEMLDSIACASAAERELLMSPQRPIVVLKKRAATAFPDVSELDTVGVMLPYTALHHLLFDFISEPLVMTSCNVPGEPIAVSEMIGAYFLTHERPIVNRCDDSVIKVINGKLLFLRRSRGFVPLPVALPLRCADTIALGAELNSVICSVKGDRAFLSQYIGETSKLATYDYLKETVDRFIRLTRSSPKIIACDLHPDYNSTAYAKELAARFGARLVQVQHHKAHVAAVAAEHNIQDYVGIAMDGLGYGDDGMIWGGEVFAVENGFEFARVGHLEEQPQLGGDSATIHPKKMLFGILSRLLPKEDLVKLKTKNSNDPLFLEEESELYLQLLKNDYNVSRTTSAGRVLDAVAALLGICEHRSYDGRPAILLEAAATEPIFFEPVLDEKNGKTILLTTPLFRFILDHLDEEVGVLAATAQMYLAKGMLMIAKKYAETQHADARRDRRPIVFSGGVAYNRMISSYMLENGVLLPKELPCGDGGLCYGQAYLANLLVNQRV